MAPFSFSALFSVFENGLHVWSTSLHPHSRSFFWMVHIFLPNLTASECFNNVLKAAWRAVALEYMVGLLDGATVEWSWSERDNRFSDWKRLFSLCQTKQWIFFIFHQLLPKTHMYWFTYLFTNQWADTSLMVDPFSCHIYTSTGNLLCKICWGSGCSFQSVQKNK